MGFFVVVLVLVLVLRHLLKITFVGYDKRNSVGKERLINSVLVIGNIF